MILINFSNKTEKPIFNFVKLLKISKIENSRKIRDEWNKRNPLIEEESALTDSNELISLHEALQRPEETLPVALHDEETVAEAMPVIDAHADAELLREIEAAEAELAASTPATLPVVETVAEAGGSIAAGGHIDGLLADRRVIHK